MSQLETLVTPEERIITAATFIAYIALLAAIGLYARKVLKRTVIDKIRDRFYVAGRGLGAIAVAFLIAASLCSVGTFVGGPGLSWKLGIPWAAMVGGSQIFMNFLILYGIGRKFGIIARRIKAVSVGDILYERYERDKLIVLLYTIPVLVFLIPYCSVQFVGSSRIFEVMTGWPYMVALILAGLVTVFYVTVGGFRGVSLAIVVQGVFMTIATIALIAAAFGAVYSTYGGLVEANEELIRIAGEEFMNLYRLPPALVISWWIIFTIGLIACPHPLMATLSYKSIRAMKIAIIIGSVAVTLWTYGLCTWAGLFAKLFFPELPVPDHAVPALTLRVVPPWLAGIVYAGVISAALSTIASMTILMSSAFLQHIYRTIIKPTATAEELKKVAHWATLIIGITAFLLAITQPPALEYIIIFAIGGLMSSLFWPLIVGMYWRRGNKYGAISSMIVGFTVFALGKSKLVPQIITLFGGADPVLPGVIFSGITYAIVSLLTSPPSTRVIKLFWGLEPVEEG